MRYLAFCLGLTILGCAAERSITPGPPSWLLPLSSVQAVNPLFSLQAGANALVLLEDLTEDPETDAQTATPFEVLADFFATPVHVALLTGLGLPMLLYLEVRDMVAGNPKVDSEQRFRQIKSYLSIRRAAPEAYYDCVGKRERYRLTAPYLVSSLPC
jgi:hypothetical protein